MRQRLISFWCLLFGMGFLVGAHAQTSQFYGVTKIDEVDIASGVYKWDIRVSGFIGGFDFAAGYSYEIEQIDTGAVLFINCHAYTITSVNAVIPGLRADVTVQGLDDIEPPVTVRAEAALYTPTDPCDMPKVAVIALNTGEYGISKTDAACLEEWAAEVSANCGGVGMWYYRSDSAYTVQTLAGGSDTLKFISGYGMTVTSLAGDSVVFTVDTSVIGAADTWLGSRLLAGSVSINVADDSTRNLVIDTLDNYRLTTRGFQVYEKLNGPGVMKFTVPQDSMVFDGQGASFLFDSTLRFGADDIYLNNVALWKERPGSAPYSLSDGSYAWVVDSLGLGSWTSISSFGQNIYTTSDTIADERRDVFVQPYRALYFNGFSDVGDAAGRYANFTLYNGGGGQGRGFYYEGGSNDFYAYSDLTVSDSVVLKEARYTLALEDYRNGNATDNVRTVQFISVSGEDSSGVFLKLKNHNTDINYMAFDSTGVKFDGQNVADKFLITRYDTVQFAREFGANLITNGTFDSGSDWILGDVWSIAGGVATATSGTDYTISQTGLSTLTGDILYVEFDYSDVTDGSAYFKIYLKSDYTNNNSESTVEYNLGDVPPAASSGHIGIYILNKTDNPDFSIYSYGISIDNVKVRKLYNIGQVKPKVELGDTTSIIAFSDAVGLQIYSSKSIYSDAPYGYYVSSTYPGELSESSLSVSTGVYMDGTSNRTYGEDGADWAYSSLGISGSYGFPYYLYNGILDQQNYGNDFYTEEEIRNTYYKGLSHYNRIYSYPYNINTPLGSVVSGIEIDSVNRVGVIQDILSWTYSAPYTGRQFGLVIGDNASYDTDSSLVVFEDVRGPSLIERIYPFRVYAMNDTSANSIEFYEKYRFINSSPSLTLNDTSIMAWRGTGSAATPIWLNKETDLTWLKPELQAGRNVIMSGSGTASLIYYGNGTFGWSKADVSNYLAYNPSAGSFVAGNVGVNTMGKGLIYAVPGTGGTPSFMVFRMGLGGVTTYGMTIDSTQVLLDGPLKFGSYPGSITGTPSKLVSVDADGDVIPITLGTNLSFSGTTLNATGGGSFTSFTAAGDTGSNQTISDGNTLTLAGGWGVNTSGAATDIINIVADSSQVATQYDILQTTQGWVNGTGASPSVAYWSDANTLTYDPGFTFTAASDRINVGADDPNFTLYLDNSNIEITSNTITQNVQLTPDDLSFIKNGFYNGGYGGADFSLNSNEVGEGSITVIDDEHYPEIKLSRSQDANEDEVGETVTNNSILGMLSFRGWRAANTDSTSSGIRAVATENWSGTATGSKLIFSTTDNTTTTLDDRLIIEQNDSITANTSIKIVRPGITADREHYLTFKTSDATNDLGGIGSASYRTGTGTPSFWGYSADSINSPLTIRALIPSSRNTSTGDPMISIQTAITNDPTDPNSGTFSEVNARPLLAFYRSLVGGTGSLIYTIDGSGNTVYKPALGEETSTADFDIQGSLRLRPYGSTPTGNLGELYVDGTDSVIYYYDGLAWVSLLGGGGTTYTFSNGLTESGGAVKLGGALTQNTTIDGDTYDLVIDGSHAAWQLQVTNDTGGGIATQGINGIQAAATSGIGGSFSSNSGNGLQSYAFDALAADLFNLPTSTTGVENVVRMIRSSIGTAANDIAGSLQLYTKIGGGGNAEAASIDWVMTDVTNGSPNGSLEFHTMNNNTIARKMAIADNGKVTFDTYGVGTHTGTVAKWLAVTSAGIVIEENAPTGGTTNLTFTGASSPYTLNSDTGTDVTFAEGTGITLSRSTNELTIAVNRAATGIYGGDGSLTTDVDITGAGFDLQATGLDVTTFGFTGEFALDYSSAATNTQPAVLALSHMTSGTAATNFGASITYELENASGTAKAAGLEGLLWSDATNASEDADFQIKLMTAGAAAAQKLLLKSTGEFNLNAYGTRTFTGTEAYSLGVTSAGKVIETYPKGVVPNSTETVYTSTQTATKGEILLMDCSAAVRTVNPPSSPVIGERFAVSDAKASSSTYNITIDFTTASQKLYGSIQNYVMNSDGMYVEFIYVGSTTGWIATK